MAKPASTVPRHVAIIMDGNGRWAQARGLQRSAGHLKGAEAVRATVEAAVRAGINTLTLYAFSADNWMRPNAEVAILMRLFGQYLAGETRPCIEQSIRVNVIGRRDRLSAALIKAIERSERLTVAGQRMHLRIAMDYSSRDSILRAAQRAGVGTATGEFGRLLREVTHCTSPDSEVDLLIRTGAERRLSDFMLWECSYAELYFSDCLWPDFDDVQFSAALADFAKRGRRFGTLAAQNG